ncbi:MAG: tRNA pseudouridine(38-40) synthase TruA [Alphaproteobacteria bacterium]|jgi:tRNA pseudouridine38-40 synthase|nr:tRNA pseudouridine(38-40) synthase TruA [Rhodospirillaceae bacterium]MDP6405977.1 tRNA pseudouridine(38-40) synthase TruA [Alphaproteobacteria bacterium]MDP6622240.1 tRNA pseudouridine(38-40) synthase TruA [Alphaproteobacteria bacterium]|tara:strand:+ start:82 stop:819 length:738 start_codon:yes stop_codon:yes gene_type:complete
MRYRLKLEYDGGPFVGWQRQANGLAVQQVLEEAIGEFSGQTVIAFGAGRTDAGVHALGQVAHFDLDAEPPPDTVCDALNYHMRNHAVAVVEAEIAAADFDARFGAISRHYRYRIVNRRAPLTVDRGRAWLVPTPLDTDAMRVAAKHLVGHHDFTTFRSIRCQSKSPLKTLDELSVRCQGEEVLVEARARSFLHSQVRSMVGTLDRVGRGKWTPDDVAQALHARERARAGPTAPAHGLYLMSVAYP